ncbi:type II toxin-antitoxin system RelE/ParE family toxin [Sphingobium phenoxybenzoativorans]|uniref:type II toxin-antitoxin system RelE/ParE family toxin n=1 Tax=Sphingobium phenoxybenzoativorans TaxID=1592790 RepID=UPI000872BA6A|nr:type II toxin-antitoxin system RelE/ParE family toxin [Sphingobium phenoxybenzoativorans]
MAEYRLTPAAARDLADIWRYTEKEWGRDQANAYALAIRAACGDLAKFPRQAQDCAHIRQGYRRRSTGRHIIYFRVTDYGIAVVRILHQRMDTKRRL